MNLDSNKNMPLYKQVVLDIENKISQGIYSKGERIPTEQELAKIYSISRVTVRNALDELSSCGLIERTPGKGTFVCNTKIARAITGANSFSQICRANGKKPGSKMIKSSLEQVSPQDAVLLQIPDNSFIVALERLRYADDVPVSFEVSHFPENYTFLLHENLNNSSLWQLLEEKYNIIFSKTKKTIELIYAPYEIAFYLNVEKGRPLLLVSAISYDQNGRPAHRSFQYILGDKFKLTMDA